MIVVALVHRRHNCRSISHLPVHHHLLIHRHPHILLTLLILLILPILTIIKMVGSNRPAGYRRNGVDSVWHFGGVAIIILISKS